jgi:hypothetical protein
MSARGVKPEDAPSVSNTEHSGSNVTSPVNLIAIAEPSCITIINALRLAGWRVGAHNDFWIEREQKWHTFWMWTHPETGRYIESEGASDLEALSHCHACMMRLAD